jgi:hypothetical protein
LISLQAVEKNDGRGHQGSCSEGGSLKRRLCSARTIILILVLKTLNTQSNTNEVLSSTHLLRYTVLMMGRYESRKGGGGQSEGKGRRRK